jgi:hypothetical protein
MLLPFIFLLHLYYECLYEKLYFLRLCLYILRYDLSDFFVNLFKFKSNISNKLEDWKKGLTIVNLDNKILDNFIITRDDIYYDKFILIDSIFFSKFQ